MRRPVRLVRNIEAGRLFDIFLVTAIVTVVITRLYLQATGFPQIGGDSALHIAHMLPGGVLMLLAIMITIGNINHSSRDTAAVVGGVGFGLFWDELGKFITKDNDYFYQPTIGLIYLTFITLYLVTRYVIRRTYQPQDYLANSIDLAMEGAIDELDPREYARAKKLLQKADPNHPMYAATQQLLESAKPGKAVSPFIVDRIIAWFHRPFRKLIVHPLFSRILLGAFYVYGMGLVGIMIFTVFYGSSEPLWQVLANPTAESNWVAAITSSISALYVIWGAWMIQQKATLQALQKFEIALLINIFVTQVFLFFRYQTTALLFLAVAIILLFAVKILMSETAEQQN